MKIVIDAMGGDNAPKEVVSGAIKALKKFDDLSIVMCGNKEEIDHILREANFSDLSRLEIIPTTQIISNDEAPTTAFKLKADSSIVKAFEALKTREDIDALLSAGSTGALLTGAVLKIGRIKGVNRPAMAPILPTSKRDKNVILIDCGANVDSKPINLLQFAIMGSEYSKSMYGIQSPKVALLSVGTESKKGNELTHEAFALLSQANINFVGNCEARDALSGEYDVVVSDGFSGNILLKATEGGVSLVLNEMKGLIKQSLLGKVGALFMKNVFKKIKNKLDYNKLGGAPFVGVNKLVIKAHGSSDRETLFSSIKQARKLVEANFISKISQAIVNASDIGVNSND